MKETLKKIQGGSTVGNKRGKRRRQRKEEREEELQQQQELNELESGIIEVTEFITANDLAEELEVSVRYYFCLHEHWTHDHYKPTLRRRYH